MNALVKKAWKDVTRRKLRTLLTVSGIALGVLALTALNTASALVGAGFRYTDSVASLPDIQFTTASTMAPLVSLLQQQPGVQLVQAEDSLTTRWTFAGGHFPLNVVGLSDFKQVSFNTLQLLTGRFPQAGAHEVVLESSARSVSPVSLGAQITLNVHGTVQQFTVVGIVRTQGLAAATLSGTARAYMDQNTLERVFQLPGANTFLIRVDNVQNESAVAKQLATVIKAQQVTIYQTDVGQATYSNATKTDTLFSIVGVISVVALLLSIFLLLSTVTAVISEQIPIIGTMKALGASTRQVLLNYMLSVGIYALLGTLVGLVAGVFVGQALTTFISTLLNLDIGSLNLDAGLVAPGILVGLGVPLLAALGPVYTGTRITVRQALAGYGIETKTGGAGKIAQFLRSIGTFLPQKAQFAFRSLFRKRVRLMLTLAGLTITGSVFLAVLVGVSSLAASLNGVLTTYHANIEISLARPLSYQQVESDISQLNGVAQVEHSVRLPVTVSNEDAGLLGLEPDNHFYQTDLQAGRWLTAQDQHVAVINSNMASRLGLHVGDTFILRDNIHQEQLQVIGITLDNNGVTPTNLGTILTTMSEADAFAQLAPNASNTFLIHTTSNAPDAIDATAIRIEDTLENFNLLVNVQTAQQLLQTEQGELQSVSALLAIATAIVALVGAMGLFNSLAMSVLERQREIGILRSIGASSRAIISIFCIEGVSLAFLAWLLALAVGFVLAYGFVQVLGALLAPLPFSFDPRNLLWMLAFMVVLAFFASVGPALGASKIKLAQTLHYE